jgi:UDP-N-acetyl-D-galactosamine dehydrogenase
VAVIGLGYVGLPLAVVFAKERPCLRTGAPLRRLVIGFDIYQQRLQELRQGLDRTQETSAQELQAATLLEFSAEAAHLAAADVFVVTVPTPIEGSKRPDLTPLQKASATVGQALRQPAEAGAITLPVVIYESTVYPGATEEDYVPILERESGLRFNQGFAVGYSPERINPGDSEHKLTTIIKVTSGSTPEAASWVDGFYGSIITAGTHPAPSLKVAEAAKVIENTQRDLNIALVNELALIFHKLGIDTLDVLEAAGSKWNFLPFRPGLVGGHCIGVDPYYLTHKAEQVGYYPEVVLAGRRINDAMGSWAAEQLMLADALTYLPADILVKVDRAAMAASLETRAPFLDHRVAAVAWRLPLAMKIRSRSGKWALRQLLDRHVPRALVERPKAGFAMPIGAWLRGPLRPWADDLLDPALLSRQGMLQPEPIQQLWQQHQSGQADHTARLWAVLMWQAWLAEWGT